MLQETIERESLPVHQLGVVAKGAYTQITGIVAPSSAAPGSRVDITVKIKNIYSSTIGIMVGGSLDYGVTPWPSITFPTYSANVDAGQTYSFSGYFTMPDKKVTIHAYSYWYGDDGWHYDEEMTKNMSVSEVVYDFAIGQPSASAV